MSDGLYKGRRIRRRGKDKRKQVVGTNLSTTSCDELVLGPKGDRCQWMFVTVADDVSVETTESTTEKKRKSRMRRNDKEPAKIGRKGKPLEGWTGGRTDRQADRV